MFRWIAPLSLLGALASGCAPDHDHDGLSDPLERELGLDPYAADTDGDKLDDLDEISIGTDPRDPDTDADWLTDGLELDHGADPLVADTDDDGYLDGDEVAEASDPVDPRSRIYKGRWPYNRDKDSVAFGTVKEHVAVGARFPRLQLVDQHGETVDLYDFAGHGTDVLFNVAAMNCGPNASLANWLATGEDPYFEELFGPLRHAIDAGDVTWIELVYSSYYEPTESTPDLASDWYDQFKNKKIPMLADEELAAWDFMYESGTPFIVLVNSNMVVKATSLGIGANSEALLLAQDRL